MTVTVEHIITVMEDIAPSQMAEKWDNVGLQVGDDRWSVDSIWTALDPLPQIIDAAQLAGVDMLIVHHPLLFAPLRSIDLSTWRGKFIETALVNRIAVFAAHSNLDSVAGGLNDRLAQQLELQGTVPLVGGIDGSANPDARNDENVSLTSGPGTPHGLGRVGRMGRMRTLRELAEDIKFRMRLDSVRVAGRADMKVDRVAVCTGSGASLLPDFYASDAQVFISGDLKYHDAQEAILAGRALIDIGHFGSEHLMVEMLAQMLAEAFDQRQMAVKVQAYRDESDPFAVV